MFKKLLLLLLISLLAVSCKNREDELADFTYIGGQIVNPTEDYIIFLKDGEVLDTVKLDDNNFFLYKTEKIKAGLFTFKHNEFQVFYIEPGDSLLMHINTIDFDESLAYSGKGAQQNNLLMDLYLRNETENQNLTKWYGLSSKEFDYKIDSLKTVKTKNFEDFRENNEVSDAFENIALANIEYDYYSKKEKYVAANRNNIENFEAGFFDYRKNINFELEELQFYYPYSRFMNRYFVNMVYDTYDSKSVVDRNSLEYNYKKLKLIDSLVTNESIKNNLLRHNAMWYLLNAKNAEEERKLFELYSKMNSNKKYQDEVNTLFDATVKLTANNTIPDVILVNTDNVLKSLHNVIKAPTVIYFWSGKSAIQYKNIHSRAAELKSKFPEYDFLGINTDSHFKKWRETVKKTGYNPETEFQLENLPDAEKKLVLNAMNKVLILDETGVILEGKTNMYNANFEELLLGFLNR